MTVYCSMIKSRFLSPLIKSLTSEGVKQYNLLPEKKKYFYDNTTYVYPRDDSKQVCVLIILFSFVHQCNLLLRSPLSPGLPS